MNITFQYHDVAASQRLETFISERLDKLQSKYDFIVNADVYFKKENARDPEGRKVIGVRLNVPGQAIFAEQSTNSFEASVAKVMEELRTQLQKQKGKMKTF
ncbi:MAG TPA: ribosome-associated translation inhibitor RaiA [Flavobacteriaceae bacterium]|nr:ribosome-associated translation inhibitor RaiA [Flavobacteriaceae bacterium]